MSISAASISILNEADSLSIEEIFAELQTNLNDSRFLSSKNYLNFDVVKILEKQFHKEPKKRKKHLAKYTGEYISSSSLIHNMDAWVYYGHAVTSVLRGDSNTAQHLLYYSELRAAMSLLATQGIGIFNNRHLAITLDKKVKLINFPDPTLSSARRKVDNTKGTHEFTWDALEVLINKNENLIKFFDNYQVGGFSMNAWLEKFNVQPSFRIALAKNLLTKLSIDLNTFSNDRAARNEASYRPSKIDPQLDFYENLNDINKVWSLAKPDIKKGEIGLDFVLLSELLQMAFKYTHVNNKSYKQAKSQYLGRVRIMLDSFGIPENRKIELIQIFQRDNSEIFSYLSLVDRAKPSFIKGMLFRSFLFLRLSNVFCNKLLKEASIIDKTVLEFWWKPFGFNAGLWDNASEPDEFADLWEDFEESAIHIPTILNQQTNNVTTNNFWRNSAHLGYTLGTCPRIGFWGLGI